MDRYTVESVDPYDMEICPDGMWVIFDDAQAAIDAAVYAERMRWIAACETVANGAERAHRPGVQTVAQVRKLAIDSLA